MSTNDIQTYVFAQLWHTIRIARLYLRSEPYTSNIDIATYQAILTYINPKRPFNRDLRTVLNPRPYTHIGDK